MKKFVLRLGLALSAFSAWALPDNISITATNPWTAQPAVFNLQRYNLRATNYHVRIYSDATTYTLLPTNQIPEPTTYRGRITGDPGAMVVGAFKADGKFYYSVVYGCRWQASAGNADPYDGTNRLSWGGWGTTLTTPNVPSLGYATNGTPATNLPVHLNWTGGFNTNAPVSYGGPPYLNNLKQIPIQRVRVLLDSDYYRFFSNLAATNLTTAILMQESRINDVDFEGARDLGVSYQITAVCIRTNLQAPFTTTTGNLGELNSYWNVDPGYSSGNPTNGFFDMAHGSVNVADAGGWAYVPGNFSVMDPDWCGFASGHEMGHNWSQGHYNSVRDYTGDNFWHITMTGSGFGHSTLDVQNALNLRRNNSKGNIEWVKYNCEVPPHASPDLATTKTNQPVSVNVLLNDYIANSNTLSIVSFETNTAAGGVVTNLGGGVLRYTPANNFVGYDLFRYYVGEQSGLKSLTAAKVLVTSDNVPLLGQWQFNETNGAVAGETTGSSQSGALYGSASFASGSVPGVGGGTALHLDGSGYVRFNGKWFDPLNASVTFSFWCKPDATPTGEQMLFMKSSQNGGGSPGLRLGMNATSFFFTGAAHGGSSSFSAKATITPQAGVWYHIVGEIDRTSALIRLWVNGVEYTGTSNTRTINAGEFIGGDNWPCVGMANDGGGSKSWFKGAIDDFRFYSKALSTAEISALYQGGGILPVGGPNPANGEINVALQPAMSWTPGATNALQYRVYLGSTSNAVAIATTNSAEFKALVSSPSYTPALLTNSSAYFWRVDEVSGTNVIGGPVWAFNTAVDAIHGGLKLYLTLDSRDTVGATTYDRSGAPFHDGTLYGSTALTNGQIYEGMNFISASNSYVSAPALNFTGNNATFLAWIKRNGSQLSYAGLVFTRGSTALGLDFRSTANQLGYHWNNEAGSYNYVSGLTPPDGQWALAVLTVTSNRAIFYLGLTNGTLTMATNNYTHVAQGFDGTMEVGRDSSGSRQFNGAMDEVGVWNRVLTFAEIGQILTNGINGNSLDGARPVADPATFTWIGDSDIYWTNVLNWATNATPVAGSTVYFNDAATGNTGTQLGQNFSIGGLNISGGLRGVGIDGTNTLTLGSGGIMASNSVAVITLATPLTLGAAQSWNLGTEVDVNVTDVVGGSGALTKNGTGTLSFTAPFQTFTGGLTVNGGLLKVLGGGWTSSFFANVSPRTLTLNSNATLETTTHSLGGLGASFYQPVITLNDGTTWQLDAEQYLNGANLVMRGATVKIMANDLRLQGGILNITNSSLVSSFTGAGSVNLFGATTFNVANGSLPTDCSVEVPVVGGYNVTKTGAGALTFTKACSYTGTTTIGAGTMQIDGGDNILPVGTWLTITNGASLVLNDNRQTVTRLLVGGSVNVGFGALRCLTASNDTYAGVISGAWDGLPTDDTQVSPSGGFVMSGPGKLTFSVAQTYSGDTWISAGTLALSGSGGIASSSNIIISAGATLDVTARTGGNIPLSSGQTLEGNGKVLGATLVNSNATISPGESVGALTTGAQTWAGGGIYNWEINHATTPGSWDSMTVTGAVTITATAGIPFNLKLVSLPGPLPGFNSASNYTWTIAATTGGVSSFAANKFSVDSSGLGVSLGGGVFSVEQQGNNLVLRFTAAVAPTISAQPQSVSTYVNSNATFTVTAGGVPTPSYQWQLNGTNIAAATATNLVVTSAQPTNEGAYTVIIANAAGSITSSVANLTLYREFGSAPAPYPSLLANDGARHLVVPGFQLGASNVISTDARTNGAGDDGVQFTTVMQPGQSATVKVVASAAGYLSGWIDFNANNSWTNAGEQVVADVALLSGTNTLNFVVPTGAAATTNGWARFRFSAETNLVPTGLSLGGEVEDYPVGIAGFMLTYGAGLNGSLTGTTLQTVNYGAAGTAVTAVPDSGYAFVNWSDSSTANPRTDSSVTNNLSVTANFAVSVNTTPTNIVAAFSGGALNLSWPADHIGWQLLVQTNSRAIGLGTNWSGWPGSTTTNQVSIPISPANPAVFLRLVYPPLP